MSSRARHSNRATKTSKNTASESRSINISEHVGEFEDNHDSQIKRDLELSDWAPHPDFKGKIEIEDIPRNLEDKEIEYIVEVIPQIMSADATNSKLLRNGIVRWMTTILKNNQFSVRHIEELKNNIFRFHLSSLVIPGTAEALGCANALGALITQMTLNSFHSSGSATSATTGIEAMKVLIYAREKFKGESCTVYYTDKMISFEEVLNSRSYIVGSMISDFVSDYDIISTDSLKTFWWHKLYESSQPIPESNYVLRLYLNTNEMYKHRVNMGLIARTLKREINCCITPIASPLSEGIIDIYPDPHKIMDTFDEQFKNKNISVPIEMGEKVYLATIVYPELSNIRVKGIQGITSLRPIVKPVWSIVLSERKIKKSDISDINIDINITNNMWIIFLNASLMKSYGLVPENIATLCETTGAIRIHYIHYNKSDVYDTPFIIVETNTDNEPSSVVFKTVENERQRYNDLVKNETNKRINETKLLKEHQRRAILNTAVDIPKPQILNMAEYVYAETEGSNLKELLAIEGIDKTLTTCNNMHVIAETFGIEAARNFIIKALYNTIANSDAYVHPTNLFMIAEIITSRGKPYGATYSGMAKQGGDRHLSLATLERAIEVFLESALYGKKEDSRNTVAAITMGAPISVGSGSVDIAFDYIDENGVEHTALNDEVYTAFEYDKDLVYDQSELPATKQHKKLPFCFTGKTSKRDANGMDIETSRPFTNAEGIVDLNVEFANERFADTGNAKQSKTLAVSKVKKAMGESWENNISTIPPNLVNVLDSIKIIDPSSAALGITVPSQPTTTLPINSKGLVIKVPKMVRHLILEPPEELVKLMNNTYSLDNEPTAPPQIIRSLPVNSYDRIDGTIRYTREVQNSMYGGLKAFGSSNDEQALPDISKDALEIARQRSTREKVPDREPIDINTFLSEIYSRSS